jgi:hypothetical protein
VGWQRAFTAELPGVEDASIEADLLRADLRTAVHLGTQRFELGPTVGIGVERMAARSVGVETPGRGATHWPTLSGGVTLNASISEPWGLAAGTGLVLPLARPNFLVRGEDEIAHRPARLGFEAWVGISWAFRSQF